MHFEEHTIKSEQTNKRFFKFNRSRKPVKESVGPLDDQGVKQALKEDKAIPEMLNEFFASVCTAEDVRDSPKSESFFLGDKP